MGRSRSFESFLRGESPGLLPRFLRLPLVPPALAFGGIVALRSRLYQGGIFPSQSLGLPVLSIGNLVAGGTGKTPFIRRLATLLLERGEHPCVLSRGYGVSSTRSELDEEGESLQRDLPKVPVIQGADRAAALAKHLSGARTPSCILLDDGGQTLGLKRDLNVFLVDASLPFGSGWPLPAGILREFPKTALRRADVVVLTRCDQVSPEDVSSLEERLRSWSGGVSILRSHHKPRALLPDARSPDSLRGRSVVCVSGIASPSAFQGTLRSLGAEIVGALELPDHHRFQPKDVVSAENLATERGAEMIVATGKDEPKLRDLTGGRSRWRFLEVDVELQNEGWDRFLELWDQRRGERRDEG